MDVQRCSAGIGSRLSALWLARRRGRRSRRRLDMHFIELIVLSVRLCERKHRGQRSHARKSRETRTKSHSRFRNRVLGKRPHAAPRKIEGDITILGAPLLSADCHSGVAQCRIHCVGPRHALRYNRGWAFQRSPAGTTAQAGPKIPTFIGEQDLPHGSYLSLSCLALQSLCGSP